MPYWSVFCLYCGGYIADALLECLPAGKRSRRGLSIVVPGPSGQLRWPVRIATVSSDSMTTASPRSPGRDGRSSAMDGRSWRSRSGADGEPPDVSLEDWALRHRFRQPGTHDPFRGYTYAEQAPLDETVP